MKTRMTALVLSLALCGSLAVPGALAYAARNDGADSGMVLHKTASANADGSYTIQLEAYATGEKLITEVTRDVPTDIVLVLDQSGSMANKMGEIRFDKYADETQGSYITAYHTRNQDYYACRHNGGSGNLYHLLADGSYASVSVELVSTPDYAPIESGRNNSSGIMGTTYTNYWANRNNLYAKVNGEYRQVTITRTGNRGNYTYTYTLPDGTVIAASSGDRTSPAFSTVDGGTLYLLTVDETQNVYTYKYTDANGVVQIILTSTGAATQPAVVFYEKVIDSSSGAVRLTALRTAVTSFVSSVAQKAAGKDGQIATTEDNVNHRIAIVGFSSSGYSNTELLTGSSITTGTRNYGTDPVVTNQSTYYYPTGYAQNGPDYYSGITDSQYGAALLDMNTQTGVDGVNAGIAAITAHGGTQVQAGMDMANKVFAQNPIPEGEQRSRVVIVFTDGAPGNTQFDKSVAQSAIDYANTAKTTYGATVYTVGIFAGADATSAGTEPAGNLSNSDSAVPAASNWFMQELSSNNGAVRTPSYYLSASDADTLNNIFQQIADQIESGGSSATLNEAAVIRDEIAPSFVLPEGTTAADITVETYHCTGADNSGAYLWTKNETALGAQASVEGSKVSVTGFDFAGHYVGTVTSGSAASYRGDKLVISFAVQPKEGFLGGNNVYTNTAAGVYEDASATEPVLIFERPQVNVPIRTVSVTAPDRNVYLLSGLTAQQLRQSTAAEVGGIALDLDSTAQNYGLESWQNGYVDISVAVRDETGALISDLENLTEDRTYTVAVTVAPKSDGAEADGTPAQAQSGSDTATIKVFRPVLTFADSWVYYGDTAPENYSTNRLASAWKHGTGAEQQTAGENGVTVEGTAPALELQYTPAHGAITESRIASKSDIGVNVAVTFAAADGEEAPDVTAYTLFDHSDCAGMACTLPENARFLLHVQTCTLTVSKAGGAEGEPYVFTVYKDGERYTHLTITGSGVVTLHELPVGTYTLAEDETWSWRYTAAYACDGVAGTTLSAARPGGSVWCTNTRQKDPWLNGYSAVVTNVYRSVEK